MEKAINKITWHRHTIDATYGYNRERSIKRMLEEDSSTVAIDEVSTEEDYVSSNAGDKILVLEELMKEITAEFSTMQYRTRWKSN